MIFGLAGERSKLNLGLRARTASRGLCCPEGPSPDLRTLDPTTIKGFFFDQSHEIVGIWTLWVGPVLGFVGFARAPIILFQAHGFGSAVTAD